MTPAEQAYENWVDEGNNRYGSVHRDAFIAGYEVGSTATFEQGFKQGFNAGAKALEPLDLTQANLEKVVNEIVAAGEQILMHPQRGNV
jgi:hypothetical protein